MKKWISVLLALWLTVSLCACGEGEAEQTAPAAETLANTTWVVADNGDGYDNDSVLISGTEMTTLRLLPSGKMVYTTSHSGEVANGWYGEWDVVDGKLYLFAPHDNAYRSYVFEIVNESTLKSFDGKTLSKQTAPKTE